jgi:sodium pump decarboxylase gamma subunit
MNNDISGVFVLVMGLGTVFVGLICIIIICKIMSALVRLFQKDSPKESPKAAGRAPERIPNRQELIAAVSAAIAEDLGTSVSNIRIHSFKKL